MTRLPGIPLDVLDEDSVNYDVVKDDMRRILTDMRRFNSPYDGSVCGVDDGAVHGLLVPASPHPACKDE